MSAPTFHFDNYAVRPVAEGDRETLDTLIENDPYHADRMDADFFLNLKPGEDAWALEDDKGSVLLYFKTQTAVRLSLQFAHAETTQEKTRNRLAMMKGMAWIEAQLRANSFREILFQTDGPELVNMAKRRMGFRETSGELRRVIEPLTANGELVEQWGGVPQVSKGGG